MAQVTDCVFCGIVAGDLPAEIVAADDRTVSFMDINPATRGHALVVPRAHAEGIYAIDEGDLAATVGAARRLALRMQEVLSPDGVNLLNSTGEAAWQTVPHFHVHVIPRYFDDPLELPWLPKEDRGDEVAEVAALLRG